MTTNQIDTTENYFRALGWEFKNDFEASEGEPKGIWVAPPNYLLGKFYFELPNITQHYPDFKKWVLEKMEGEGIVFMIDLMVGRGGTRNAFCMFKKDNLQDHLCHLEIKDNELLKTAVIAATEYWESKG